VCPLAVQAGGRNAASARCTALIAARRPAGPARRSIAWSSLVLQPTLRWLLATAFEPVYGRVGGALLERLLLLLFDLTWLLPAYLVTLLINCVWWAACPAAGPDLGVACTALAARRAARGCCGWRPLGLPGRRVPTLPGS
jgi:hypothetical protein